LVVTAVVAALAPKIAEEVADLAVSTWDHFLDKEEDPKEDKPSSS
jgi:hypothetical protein